ncbi:MAG: EamA family transporter, partial [Limisphaerales bacterium]
MNATVKYKEFGGSIRNSATDTAATNEHSGKTASHKTSVEILMLVATFCWASNIVAGKEALLGFTPLALAQLRMLLAALLYAAMFLLWRKRPKLHLTLRHWLLLGLMAFTGITLNQICFLGGLARTSVTHTG